MQVQLISCLSILLQTLKQRQADTSDYFPTAFVSKVITDVISVISLYIHQGRKCLISNGMMLKYLTISIIFSIGYSKSSFTIQCMLSKDKNQINTTKNFFLVDNTRYINVLQKQTKTR